MIPELYETEIIFKDEITSEYSPFIYNGINDLAKCYLKLKFSNDELSVLFAQIPEYLGTDITSGIDLIVSKIVNDLLEHANVKIVFKNDNIVKKILRKIIRDIPDQEKKELKKEMIEDFIRKVKWIGVYPPGVGLSQNESYALISFNHEMVDNWKYGTKEAVAKAIGVTEDEISVDYEKLWQL